MAEHPERTVMKSLSRGDVETLLSSAAVSPRLRANANMHPSLDDPVQRFVNAMEPGTYVRPHRHREEGRWELFVIVAGAVGVLSFDENGRVIERVELNPESGAIAVEIPPGSWHAVVCLVPATLLFEVKPGPYAKTTDKDFATWAPAEGEPNCAQFERWLREARPGSKPPTI
jgi:cupin fold WbuC family metalloprotein